jgi:hypothetical protein
MRVRFGVLACSLLVLLALTNLSGGHGASARLQEATPEAQATPTAGEEPEPETTLTGPVTLVMWYEIDESEEFLAVGPLRTNNALVAGADSGNDRALSGQVDFADPDNDDQPRIVVGQSVFDAYAVYEDNPDSIFRWIYTNDDPSIRPATLVLQVDAVEGPYEGYSGTATFVSRSADPLSGVLVIVINPPADDEE